MNADVGFLYRALKWYFYLVLRLYYRRFSVSGKENVPSGGPLIFAVNHQNAFMDAIVVAVATRRNPWFLTRASVFSSRFVRFWLNKLQMIPIYRFRDGMTGMKRNDETMARCSNLLNDDHCLLIFPEGNHDHRWALRPLQKGLARLAFAAREQSGGSKEVRIVPVGLQYEDMYQSFSDLLISFGKPLLLSDYASLYRMDASEATKVLMEDLRLRMEALIVNIKPAEEYDRKKRALLSRPRRQKPLEARLNGDQQFLASWHERCMEQSIMGSGKRKSWCFPSAILLLPHMPAIWTIRAIVNALVKDPHWTSSIRLAAFAFAAPPVYVAEIAIFSRYFAGRAWLPAIVLALLISGMMGLRLRDRCRGTAL